MGNQLYSSTQGLIPELSPLTKENYWEFRLHCITTTFQGSCAELSKELAVLYNFDSDYTREIYRKSFIHEFSHILLDMVFKKLAKTSLFDAVPIPHQFPANGNNTAELLVAAIENAILSKQISPQKMHDEFLEYVGAYPQYLKSDRLAMKVANDYIEQQEKPTSVFNALRSLRFEADDPLGRKYDELGIPSHTKWGELLQNGLSDDMLYKIGNEFLLPYYLF